MTALPPADGLLCSEAWGEALRTHLAHMLRQPSGSRPPLAALDFDRTCLFGDISEFLLGLLALRTGEDLVGAYEAACHKDLRQAYIDLVPTLIGGRTEPEVRALGLEAYGLGVARGVVRARAEMVELVWALQRHGWDVWVITASPEVLIQAVAQQFGIHPHRVRGMRSPVGPDGRYLHEVLEPVPYREGKLEVLRQAAGRDPTFAAGDSRSDAWLLFAAQFGLLFDHGDAALAAEAAEKGVWIAPGEQIR